MLKYASAAVVFFAFIATPFAANAEIKVDEVRGGLMAQSCCGLGSNKEDGVSLNAEVLFASPQFLSVLGAPRPILGGNLATANDATSQLYAGLEWEFDISEKFFLSGGGGGAIHNGETDDYDPIADAARVDETLFFGCRALFRIHANGGYRVSERVNVMITWSHISNAGLCNENEGLDNLGVRMGWRF